VFCSEAALSFYLLPLKTSANIPVIFLLITSVEGLNYFIGAFISKMALDDQNGMNHAWDPEQQSQENIKNKLKGFAAKQDSKRRKDNSNKIPHFITFQMLKCSVLPRAQRGGRDWNPNSQGEFP
jgi:hypothetical protein